jgi:Cdc6-like AAA superfamily ATPase
MSGLVSTSNSKRIWAAFEEISQRLVDDEIMGIGCVFGDPGRGKTVTAEQIHALSRENGEIPTYWVEAKPTWTPSAMLRSLLSAAGVSPRHIGADNLLDELKAHLKKRPGVYLIDESHRFVGRHTLVEIIKYLHDATQSGFLLLGESQTRDILRRYLSFDSRINDDAVVEARPHTLEDVTEVVHARCQFAVDEDVCRAIHREASNSMRRVVKKCRQMAVFCRTNSLDSMDLAHYQAMEKQRKQAVTRTKQRSMAVRLKPTAAAARGR